MPNNPNPYANYSLLADKIDDQETRIKEQDQEIDVLKERTFKQEAAIDRAFERLGVVAEKLEIVVENLNKITERLEATDDDNGKATGRLDKIEEKLAIKEQHRKAWRSAFYGLGLTGAGVIVTRVVETWLTFIKH